MNLIHDPIYDCPKCQVPVVTPNLYTFRCPACGYKTHGVQLSFLDAGTTKLKENFELKNRGRIAR
jgi:hypothetical protein